MAFASALAASVLSGTPTSTELPIVALGWPVLLHLERGAGLTGLLAVAVLIWWRAGRGELPIRFWNIEYAIEDAAAEAKQLIDSQERRILNLEDAIGVRETRVEGSRKEAYLGGHE